MMFGLDHVGADRRALGIEPATLARELEGGSFAEAEEFLLDVKRKVVLDHFAAEAAALYD